MYWQGKYEDMVNSDKVLEGLERQERTRRLVAGRDERVKEKPISLSLGERKEEEKKK